MLFKFIFLSLILPSIIFAVACASVTSQDTTKSLESIPLELTTNSGNKQNYIDAEEIQFLLSLGDDAYIYMFHVDADGAITQLLPNPAQQTHFYKSGYFLTIPEYKDLFRFKVAAPYGEETIWIIASDTNVDIQRVDRRIEAIRAYIKRASHKSYNDIALKFNTLQQH